MAARTAVFWYIALILIENITSVPKSGPYDMIIKELKSCDDVGTGQMHFDTKINHVGGGKHVYNANVQLGLPINEDFVGKMDVQQWSSQGYRPRAITHTAKGCKAIWPQMETFLISFTKAAGYNLTGCPVPQGNYTLNDWEVEFKFDRIPVLPYNKYKTVFDFYYKKVKIGCLIVYLEIVEKKKE